MTMLSVLIMFLAAFTALAVPVPTQRNLVNFVDNRVRVGAQALPVKAQEKVFKIYPELKSAPPAYRNHYYCPLAPAAVVVGYILGPALSALAVGIFLFLGLAGPFFGVHAFAGGGGLSYCYEPGFGYLLALIPTAFVAGMITRGKRTSLSQLLGVAGGLTVTHLCGLMYLFGSVLVSYLINGNSAALSWQPWVFELARNMTWYPLPFDVIAAIALIGIGFPFRWLASTLSAPDIARSASAAEPNDAVPFAAERLESIEYV